MKPAKKPAKSAQSTTVKPKAKAKAAAPKPSARPAKAPAKRVPTPVPPASPRRRPENVPPILLEDDSTLLPPPSVATLADRFLPEPAPAPMVITEPAALVPPPVSELVPVVEPAVPEPPPAPAPVLVSEAPAALPVSYETGRLLLAARDPQWLYLHWDVSPEAAAGWVARAPGGSLRLRLHRGHTGGDVVTETVLPADTRSWFERATGAGSTHVAQLGFHGAQGAWVVVATSDAVATPVAAPAPEESPRFETIPAEVSLKDLAAAARAAGHEDKPLVEAIRELRAAGHPLTGPEIPSAPASPRWSPARTAALTRASRFSESRRVSIGSLEFVEQREGLEEEISPAGPPGPLDSLGLPGGAGELSSAGLALPLPGVVTGAGERGVTSQAEGFGGGAPGEKSFWFNVNAELVIYGATEPNARVTLGGRVIQLRPDGTFACRFSLPDGKFQLEAIAISADGEDGRAADLKFSRDTRYHGDVGAHAQDPKLKAPYAHHIEAALQ